MEKKKRVALVLLVVFSLFLLASAVAEGIVPDRRYAYTASISANLSLSDGVASCSGNVQPSNKLHSASITVKLQQNAGGTWTTIASWSGSASSGLTAAASGSKSVSSGYDYRVVSDGKIKNSGGTVLESPSATSPTKSY